MYDTSHLSNWYTTQDMKKLVNCIITQTNDLWAAELEGIGFYTARAELNDRWQVIVYNTICDCVKYGGRMACST